MNCKVCGARAESNFCELHRISYENLLKKYEIWKNAVKISWNNYLKEIKKNPYAGVWVKEVAQYLLSTSSN